MRVRFTGLAIGKIRSIHWQWKKEPAAEATSVALLIRTVVFGANVLGNRAQFALAKRMTKRSDLLTEDQKEALRYALTMTSEQIAPLLGITKKGVDRRIDMARARLNGMSRREAAELLAREEGRLTEEQWDNVPQRRIPLANPIAEPASELSSDVPNIPSLENVPVYSIGGNRRNRLDVWQRLGVIMMLMAIFAAASTAYIYLLRMH